MDYYFILNLQDLRKLKIIESLGPSFDFAILILHKEKPWTWEIYENYDAQT